MSLKIFIVEDDAWYGEVLRYHLELNPDHKVTWFKTGKACLENLHTRPDVICMDYGLPDMPGDKLLSGIRAMDKKVSVIVISGQSQVSVAINMLKFGASDYIVKDDNTKDILWSTLIRIRENTTLKKEVEVLKEQLSQKFIDHSAIIGQSAAMKEVFDLVAKAADSSINVLISGETGTGKEIVAKTIHYNSSRRKRPFVCVNMAAVPRDLVESELFGHEKGSFTGALGRRPGKFEEAQGGTLFLDEIAELDLTAQAKLLRVLQEREVTRVGGNESVKLDIRIITASHRSLWAQVQAGLFREDLYYRIVGIPIRLPALRERGNDIQILAMHFIQEFASTNSLVPVVLSPDARLKLMSYNYPGNIRELKAMIELAFVMSNGVEIHESEISFPGNVSNDSFLMVEKTLEEHTWDIIEFYMKKYNASVSTVAGRLGIGKSTIYNMLKKNIINN